LKNRLTLLLVYFIDRASELSTWLGLIALVGFALHKSWDPDRMNTMAQYCMLAFGVIAAVFPDQIAKLKDYANHFLAGTTPKGDS
jgi:hypothetical protein